MVSNWFQFVLILRHSIENCLIQSEVKSKPIVILWHSFSSALHQLRVISSSFDWFTGLSVSFVIGKNDYNDYPDTAHCLSRAPFQSVPTDREPGTLTKIFTFLLKNTLLTLYAFMEISRLNFYNG